MRLSRPLAWTLVLLGVLTAGLLRQFNDRTPVSPFVDPTVGSLLFGVVFLLLLVSAWERRRGGLGRLRVAAWRRLQDRALGARPARRDPS